MNETETKMSRPQGLNTLDRREMRRNVTDM